ncbi:MAG: bifunctional (p)ppGpp synthetase/guanosine-3',5'-bis(diphosphate) 3'-pyrophosphohydrolase, partial [Sphingomonas sp.]|uniref:RelA/SpoT family protein n=1 Tax=Sphingomonas sp. TaxID=28214 RepID=UPI002272D3AE
SGDPYFSHPLEVAAILTDLKLDDATIAAALLHDTIEDTPTTRAEIDQLFGPDIGHLVEGLTKLKKLDLVSREAKQAENLRKLLLAIADDVRVLLVKLADRLHNMRTLHHIKNPDKRKRIARETMEIYAPLAERIGMYEFMKEMQTLAFRELEPEAYESITKRLDSLQVEGEDRIAKIASGLKLLLARGGVDAEISGREKHPYSIWRKMSERHVSLEQLSDIMAFRATVETEEECYRALGVIHRRWPMVPGRFKDYISTPKRNGYRSLHTTIMHAGDTRVEIQIRTRDMHAQAEFGLAAHWAYKQDSVRPDTQVSWIRDLIEILEHAESPEELLEHTRMAMYQDRIFAFTPKGELIQLPKGATPIDFAYAVHTDLGDQAVGAKVNGKVVPLRTEIQQGDQVAILRSKAQEPQANWLNFAITGKARAAIRRHIRHKERDETMRLGRKLYDEIVQRLPAPPGESALKDAIKRLKLSDDGALMEAIARRKLTDAQVMEAVMPGSTEGAEDSLPTQSQAIEIKGLTPGVAFHFSEDCRPIPGDRIVGVRRPGEPIEVHRIDCASLGETDEEDWVDLTWGDKAEGGTARIAVTLKNEPGALGAVATLIGQQKANILGLRMDSRDTTFHTNTIDLEVRNATHLMRLLAALRAADAVNSAERV